MVHRYISMVKRDSSMVHRYISMVNRDSSIVHRDISMDYRDISAQGPTVKQWVWISYCAFYLSICIGIARTPARIQQGSATKDTQ